MVLLSISAADILQLGLHAVGFSVQRQHKTRLVTNIMRFRASFGPSPETCSDIFTDLQTTQIVEARIDTPDLIHLLMAMNWLKTYKTEAELAGFFHLDEKTVRKWVWKYTFVIQALKGQKVSAVRSLML
jgi:hypothetical protein